MMAMNRKPPCMFTPTDPWRRLALAVWIRDNRAAGNVVTRPPRCSTDVCPRHGTKPMVPHTGLGFVCYEGIGYGVITKAALKFARITL